LQGVLKDMVSISCPSGCGRGLARWAILGLLGVLAACEGGFEWKSEGCRAQTFSYLAERGVPRSDARIYFVDRDVVGQSERIQGYDIWVRLDGCNGSLVFVYNQACQLRRVYARGGCEVPSAR
jgi:hypothetical protein